MSRALKIALVLGFAAVTGCGSSPADSQSIPVQVPEPLASVTTLAEVVAPVSTTQRETEAVDDVQQLEQLDVSLSERWFLVPPDDDFGQWWPSEIPFTIDQTVYSTDPNNPAGSGIATQWDVGGFDEGVNYAFASPFLEFEAVEGREGTFFAEDQQWLIRESESETLTIRGDALTLDQLLAFVDAAVMIGDEISFPQGLPDGFVALAPSSRPDDHLTGFHWSESENTFELAMWPAALERIRIVSEDVVTPIEIRGSAGLLQSTDSPLWIAWFEDGYTFQLTAEPGMAVEDLIRSANGLERVSEQELAAFFNDPFVQDQRSIVAGWLDETPLPIGFDRARLVNYLPRSEFMMTAMVQNSVRCGWYDDMLDALLEGDRERYERGVAAIGSQTGWPSAVLRDNYDEFLASNLEADAQNAAELMLVDSAERFIEEQVRMLSACDSERRILVDN